MNLVSPPIPYNILPFRGRLFPASLSGSTFDGAAEEWSEKLGVTKPMMVMSMLSAVIPVMQALVDVAIPGDGGNSPTCGFIIIMGPPGSGKTRSAEATLKLPRAFQQLQLDVYNEQLAEYKVKLAIWKKQRRTLLDLIPSQFDGSMDTDTNSNELASELAKQLEAQLIEHERNRPQPPRAMQLIAEEATIEAVHAKLAEHPVLSLASSEGGIVFKSRAISHLEQLNSLWSGSPIMINRKTGQSFQLTDARLSILLAVQPHVVTNFLKTKGQDARDNGFTSRCMLFSTPKLTLVPDYSASDVQQNGTVAQFEERMSELLLLNKAHFDDPALPRRVMNFSPEAEKLFKQLQYEIRMEKALGGRFANVHDHANRLGEQAARIAALLQYFEAPDSDISAATLRDAINICAYCSDCYLVYFDPPSQEYQDAQLLNEWLNLNMRPNPALRLVYKNHVRQFGPNALREKNRLNHALMLLQQQGIVGLFMWGKHHVINLHPHLPIDNGMIAYLLSTQKK